MDFLGELRILAMPKWLKAALATFLVSLFGASIAVGVIGAIRADRPSWIEVGVSAMAASLPFVVVGSVLLFSSTGTSALRERTRRVLENTIPSTLARMCHLASGSYASSEVTTTIEGSGFSAYYEVRMLHREVTGLASLMQLRIEINVRKANVSLCIRPGRLTSSSPQVLDNDTLRAAFHSHFPSTLAGAVQEGYAFPGSTFVNTTDDRLTFVLVRSLSDNFLWDSSEQLYFCQDLAMMLTGFLLEQPALFTCELTGSASRRRADDQG